MNNSIEIEEMEAKVATHFEKMGWVWS